MCMCGCMCGCMGSEGEVVNNGRCSRSALGRWRWCTAGDTFTSAFWVRLVLLAMARLVLVLVWLPTSTTTLIPTHPHAHPHAHARHSASVTVHRLTMRRAGG